MAFKEVKARGGMGADVDPLKEEIRAFIREHGHQPSERSTNPAEKRLHSLCRQIRSPLYRAHDRDFAVYLTTVPTHRASRVDELKDEIREFIHANRRKPSIDALNTTERRLARAVDTFIYGKRHDPAFAAEVASAPSARDHKRLTFQNDIRAFIRVRGYKPSAKAHDAEEQMLGRACARYTKHGHRGFDPAFAAEIKDVPTWREVKQRRRSSPLTRFPIPCTTTAPRVGVEYACSEKLPRR